MVVNRDTLPGSGISSRKCRDLDKETAMRPGWHEYLPKAKNSRSTNKGWDAAMAAMEMTQLREGLIKSP